MAGALILLVGLGGTASGLLSLDETTVKAGDTLLSSTSLSHDTPSGTDRLLVVSASWDDGNDGSLDSVTYAGETLSCLSKAERKDKAASQICYLVSPPTGSNSLDLTWSVSVNEWVIVARSLTDVDQDNPIGATSTANGSSTDATDSLTATEADGTIVSALATTNADVTVSPIEGTNEDVEDSAGLSSTGISAAAGRTNVSSTQSYDSGWNVSETVEWALSLVEVHRTPEKVSFAQSSSSGDEATTSPSVSVKLDRESSDEITVDYSWTSGNASNDDHNVSSGTISFPAGSTSETLTLDVTDDVADEPDETLDLELSNPSGAERATPYTHTYTINDDDPNHAPDASASSVSTDEDTDVSDSVSATDQDQNDTIDSFAVDTQPSHGSLTFDPSTGDFTYSPDADYDGDDSFTFTATDEHGATSSAATVDVTVNSVNDAPSASDDSASVDEDSSVSVDVLANDDDVDGDSLSVASTTSPTHGSVSVNDDDTITYTPDADYNGADSFDYDVSDGTTTSTATVSLSVDAVNDPPSASDDSASTPVNETVWVDVLSNDADVDGDTLTVASASSPGNGTTSLPGNGTVEYTPDDGYEGSDSFTYNVSDGTATAQAAVDVTVGSGGSTEILSSNVRVIEGSLDSDPTLGTFASGSSIFLQLENGTGGIDLASLGASNTTTLEINLTTNNFTPTTLMGRTQVVDWSNSTNDNGTENVSLELQPIAMAFIDDCETYTKFMGYCGPSSPDQWPNSSDEDQADVAFDAGLRVFLSDLSYLNSTMQSRMQGAYMTTDAQAIGQMNLSGSDSPGGASLRMPVAGPHTLPNGSQNYGFFEARLPDGLLNWWGLDDPSRLTGQYEGENRSVTITNVSKGTKVRMDIHYSSGEVNITEDTTDPTAKAGSNRTVTEDEAVGFDGSNSTDNQEVTSYTWTFGDGETASGVTPNHTFTDPGTYEVTLNVSDAAGNWDEDNLTVTVEAQPSSGGGGGFTPDEDSQTDEDDGAGDDQEEEEDASESTDSETSEPSANSGGGGSGSNDEQLQDQSLGTEEDDRATGTVREPARAGAGGTQDPGSGSKGSSSPQTARISDDALEIGAWLVFASLIPISIFGISRWA